LTLYQEIERSQTVSIFAPCYEGMAEWIDGVKGTRRRLQRSLDAPDLKDDQGNKRVLPYEVFRYLVPLVQLLAQCQ
jgi:hypothetical protein